MVQMTRASHKTTGKNTGNSFCHQVDPLEQNSTTRMYALNYHRTAVQFASYLYMKMTKKKEYIKRLAQLWMRYGLLSFFFKSH